MDSETSWRYIAAERLGLADLLESCPDELWDTPSLCDGWRIRDVAAHLALVGHPPGVSSMVAAAVRARGSFHRMNRDLSVRHADRQPSEIVADLRAFAGSRRLPVVTNYRNALFDILVHGQDIAVPLGRQREMPVEAAAASATRVWTMGWPFWAKRHLRGYRLVASDVDWSVGAGDEVRGPIAALLLLLTGRTARLAALTGPGAERLVSRLGRWAPSHPNQRPPAG